MPRPLAALRPRTLGLLLAILAAAPAALAMLAATPAALAEPAPLPTAPAPLDPAALGGGEPVLPVPDAAQVTRDDFPGTWNYLVTQAAGLGTVTTRGQIAYAADGTAVDEGSITVSTLDLLTAQRREASLTFRSDKTWVVQDRRLIEQVVATTGTAITSPDPGVPSMSAAQLIPPGSTTVFDVLHAADQAITLRAGDQVITLTRVAPTARDPQPIAPPPTSDTPAVIE